MRFNAATLLPLVAKLGDYLKQGFDYYVETRASGIDVDVDMTSAFLTMKMQDWNPAVKGKSLLDDDTRASGARFLAGIAFNLANGKEDQ
jgi:hypothetical protein